MVAPTDFTRHVSRPILIEGKIIGTRPKPFFDITTLLITLTIKIGVYHSSRAVPTRHPRVDHLEW